MLFLCEMDATMPTMSIKPKTMAELMPELNGILSKGAIQTLTDRKQPRSKIAHTRTTEKVLKPVTIAEMRADILALKVRPPKKCAQEVPSSKKNTWNSSVKVDGKTISHTANGQFKHNPVKKMLNFQPKPKAVSNLRSTMAPASLKFPKPEFRAKKSLALQARNNVRLSGISQMAETPVMAKSNVKSTTPRVLNQKRLLPVLPDTPLNDSWKSSCDASFLQKEREINSIEEKTEAIAKEIRKENIPEVPCSNSTPFKAYRSVQEFFNHSSDMENSALYNDNTIMCFDKPPNCKQVDKREESVIVSLCDLLNNACVTNSDKISTENEDLLKIEMQTEHHIKIIDNVIDALKNMKVSHLKSLQYVKKLIEDKKGSSNDKNVVKANKTLNDVNKPLIGAKETLKATRIVKTSPEQKSVVSKPCSVIKSCSKSPSYTIPKKSCFRKNVSCKSMPDISREMSTPPKVNMGNKALSVYLQMKAHMNFLNTPNAKPHVALNSDTPAVTSRNLQKQLEKFYGED